MMFYECDDCGTDVPNERKKIARFFPNLCVTCASHMDTSIAARPTLVPTHKGAYQPVTNRRSLYEATCNPKNYDHEFARSLGSWLG